MFNSVAMGVGGLTGDHDGQGGVVKLRSWVKDSPDTHGLPLTVIADHVAGIVCQPG